MFLRNKPNILNPIDVRWWCFSPINNPQIALQYLQMCLYNCCVVFIKATASLSAVSVSQYTQPKSIVRDISKWARYGNTASHNSQSSQGGASMSRREGSQTTTNLAINLIVNKSDKSEKLFSQIAPRSYTRLYQRLVEILVQVFHGGC